MNTSKHELKFLEQVNETNMLLHNSRILEVGTLDNDDLVDELTNDVRGGQDDDIAGSVVFAQVTQTCEARFNWWPSVAIPTPILQPYNSARGVHIWLSDLLQPMSGETRPTGEGCCSTTEEELS